MNELTITDPTFATLADKVLFTPVEVKHGRKFRGFGYVVGSYEKSNGGYSGSGVRPLKYYEVVRVYIPASKGFDSYNEYVESEKVEIPEGQRRKDLLEYVNGVLKAALKRCGNDRKWRANYLRKVLEISGEPVVTLLNFMDR